MNPLATRSGDFHLFLIGIKLSQEQTGLVAIAQLSTWMLQLKTTVSIVDDLSQQIPLRIGLFTTVHLIRATLDIPRREDAIQRHLARKVGVLDATGEFKELLADGIGVDIRRHIVLIVEERFHQTYLTGVQCRESSVALHCERVDTVVGQILEATKISCYSSMEKILGAKIQLFAHIRK